MAVVESKFNHKQAFIHAIMNTGMLLLLCHSINYATETKKNSPSDFQTYAAEQILPP
jgi:hypothetical protein